MKKLVLFFILILSFNVFALSDAELEKCFKNKEFSKAYSEFEKLSPYTQAVEDSEGPIFEHVMKNLRNKLLKSKNCEEATSKILPFNQNLEMMIEGLEFILGRKIIVKPITEM